MIFDGHSDIFTDVTIRRLKGEINVINQYHINNLRKGNIEGGCFVIWIDTPYVNKPEKRLGEILKSIKDELINNEEIVLVRNMKEIEIAKSMNKFYIFLGMEGLSGIGNNINKIHELYNFGVRHCMLTWNEENLLATGVKGNKNRGLTSLGKKAVKLIEEKNIILDVSHLNEKSFWDILNITKKPIIASHSNSKTICNVDRNLSDQQLLAIRDTKGIVGLNSYSKFISDKIENQNIDGLIDQAKYIAYKIGVDYLSLGFDFLDFLENESTTEGLENCSKVPNFIEKLKEAGFNKKEIDMISRENWYRIINGK